MKVGILTVQIPFISGGAEIHATSLKNELYIRGYEAEIISIPFKWYPPERILDCMLMARFVDIEEVNGIKIDRVISLKFPAYYISHANKVAWILHQHRQAYELYETAHSDLHQTKIGQLVTGEIKRWDNKLLIEHKYIFANSNTVRDRLRKYNNLDSETLYHPPGNYQQLRCEEFRNYILYPSRFDSMKRQHLIIETKKNAPSDLKLILIGQHDSSYGNMIIKKIAELGLSNKIEVLGPVSEKMKIDLYANCLAVYNGVYQEDYGYVTLEAFLSGKPVITHTDSGGPLEFVDHKLNGYVIAPEPDAISECLDQLVGNKTLAKEMGSWGKQRMKEKNISWDYVIERLML
jgi:glycosyltransferase involved in cell wall biosynthesis